MKTGLNKKLFFSMTFDFLTIYIPQDSSSSKTVKTYRDGLTVFRRYVTDVKREPVCIIHADETPCQVLKEEGKAAQSKSYMWLYGSGNDGLPPIRLYEYRTSRGGYHAEKFLEGFSGYLTCDGFSGYNRLKNIIRCGCLAHMRGY